MRLMFLLAVLAVCCLSPLRTQAGILYGSGYGVDPNLGGQRDLYWDIVAGPASFTPPSPYPYKAYVPKYIAPVFYGSIDGSYQWPFGELQSGYTDPATGQVSYWISPGTSDTTASITTGNYNWIAAQKFTVEVAGTYSFNFPVSGDNEIKFFIDGTVDSSDPQAPVIVGGTQVGGSWNNFGAIGTITGDVFLTTGEHTAYMTLFDFGGDTAALIGTATFGSTAAAVPEPSTYVMLAMAGVALARRRGLRSRRASEAARAEAV